jgi:hypothetical protein
MAVLPSVAFSTVDVEVFMHVLRPVMYYDVLPIHGLQRKRSFLDVRFAW